MPSPITQSIGAASGALVNSQIPPNQSKANETATVAANSPAQTRAAAEVSSAKTQSDAQRSIQRREARSEGGFAPQGRPKKSESEPREEAEPGNLKPQEQTPGRLSRVV
jgi:hypothetical protein